MNITAEDGATIALKKCSKCGKIKPACEFALNNVGDRERRRPECRECQRAYNRKYARRYYAKHRDKILKKREKWYREITRKKVEEK